MIETALIADLGDIGGLCIGIAIRCRKGIDNPFHLAIDDHRIWVSVIMQERSNLPDTVPHIAHQHDFRF